MGIWESNLYQTNVRFTFKGGETHIDLLIIAFEERNILHLDNYVLCITDLYDSNYQACESIKV